MVVPMIVLGLFLITASAFMLIFFGLDICIALTEKRRSQKIEDARTPILSSSLCQTRIYRRVHTIEAESSLLAVVYGRKQLRIR